MSWRLRVVASVPAAVLALAGCTLASSSPPAYHPDSATRDSIKKTPVVPADLHVRGALSADLGQIRSIGCTSFGGEFNGRFLLAIGGGTYQLIIQVTDYPGPRRFTITGAEPGNFDHSPVPAVGFGTYSADPMGGGAGSYAKSGTLVIAKGSQSGSVDVEHIGTSAWWPFSNRELAIRGNWQCR